MDQFQKQFQEHPVLKNLEEAAKEIDAAEKAAANDEIASGIAARAKSIIVAAAERIAAANPYLVSASVLGQVDQQARNIVPEARNFASNKNVGHLNNVNSYVEGILGQFPALPPSLTADGINAAAAAARNFKRELQAQATEYLTQVQENKKLAKAASTELEALRQQVQQEREKVAALLAKVQGEANTEMATQKGAYDKVQQELKSTQEKFLSDQQAKVTERFRELDRQDTEYQDKRKEQVSVFENHLAARLKEVQDYLEKQKRAVEQVVQATGSASLTGEYQKASKAAATSSARWRAATTAIFTALALMALGLLAWHVKEPESGTDWPETVARWSAIGAFAILGGYTARQAGRYHDIEDETRRIAMELSSFEPYLATLGDDDRASLRKELAKQYFLGGGHGRNTDARGDSESNIALVNLVRQIIEKKA